MTPEQALTLDPFLPAVEWLRTKGRLEDGTDVASAMRGEDCHPRPLFELIPDHPSRCACTYSTDMERWRP